MVYRQNKKIHYSNHCRSDQFAAMMMMMMMISHTYIPLWTDFKRSWKSKYHSLKVIYDTISLESSFDDHNIFLVRRAYDDNRMRMIVVLGSKYNIHNFAFPII